MKGKTMFNECSRLSGATDKLRDDVHKEYQRRLDETDEPEGSSGMQALWNAYDFLTVAADAVRSARRNLGAEQ
jgi:hypothetical protein